MFFFLTASRQEEREGRREGGAAVISTGPVLCCGSGFEAAQHPPWMMHITADVDFVFLQRRDCSSIYVCVCCVYLSGHVCTYCTPSSESSA